MKIPLLPLYILTRKSLDDIVETAGTTARQIEIHQFSQLLHENHTMRVIIMGDKKLRRLVESGERLRQKKRAIALPS